MNINENGKKEKEEKSWNDITIAQYQEMMAIDCDNSLSAFIEAIAICDDISTDDIRDLKIGEFQKLKESRSFLLEKPGLDFKRIIEVDGVRYGIEPEINLMSAGVFIDCEQFRRDANANLHNIIALIYRPVVSQSGDEYSIEPHRSFGFQKRAELFRNRVSVEEIFGALFFFSMVSMTSLHHTLASLTPDLMVAVNQMIVEQGLILKKLEEENGKNDGVSMI